MSRNNLVATSLALITACLFLTPAGKAAASQSTLLTWGTGFYQYFPPTGLTNIISVATGNFENLAVRPDGSLVGWTWGANGQAQAVPVPALTNVKAVAVGYACSLALKQNGTVVAWDANGETNVPPDLTNVVAISAGMNNNLALKCDGTVVSWWGSAVAVPLGVSDATAIAAGFATALVIKRDGSVVQFGPNTYPMPADLTNAVTAAMGLYHGLVLRKDGTVVAWGDNSRGQTNVPPGLTNVVAIAAGDYNSLALKSDGTVVLWGYSGFTIPAVITNVVAIASGGPNTLVLTYNALPAILRPPVDQTVYSGMTAVFNGVAVGAQPLAYQWLFKGSQIVGATDLSLVLTNVQPADAGNYRFVVIDRNGTTSASAALTVSNSPPILIQQPASQIVPLGATAQLAVAAVGSLPVSYLWQLEGTNVALTLLPQLLLTNLQANQEGNWSVLVSNTFGTAISSNAFLNVVDLAEALNATNLAWTTAGNAPWVPETDVTEDGLAAARAGTLVNAQQSILQTTFMGPGTLSFGWRASGASNYDFLSCSLNGLEQVSISGEVPWQQQTLYVGVGTQTAQWIYTKGPFWVGQNAVWLDQVTYLPGFTPVQVTTAPTSQTALAGATVSFSASVIGTPPLHYQWQFNGIDLPGATNTALTLTNAQAGNHGSYTLVATNADSAAISPSATLTVNPSRPTFILQPTNGIMLPGRAVTFAASVRGTEPFTYQWQLNGTNLNGATAAALTLTDAQAMDGTSYRVVVSNTVGSATSSPPAFLLKMIPMAITTLAGKASLGGNADGSNTTARFLWPWDVTVDSEGNLYVADRYNHSIRRIAPGGTNWVVTTWAGGASRGSADGTNRLASFNTPGGVTIDGAGNIYVADTWNHTIRRIALMGTNRVVTTIAGQTGATGTTDGTNSAARFYQPTGVALDAATNLYVVEWGNHTIRKITPIGTNWVVSTLAGGRGSSGFINGTGTVARFSYPEHLALDSSGNVYVADAGNNAVRKITPSGTNWVVSTLAGGKAGSADGVSTNAQFVQPKGIGVDSAGNIYVADTTNNIIRRITAAGVVTTPAGLAGAKGSADGIGTSARFYQPGGITLDAAGNIYVVDSSNYTVRKGTPSIPPYFIVQPQDQTVEIGNQAAFNAVVAGSPPLCFQWQFNGTNLAGATDSSLIRPNVRWTDAGNYTLLLTNAYGSTLSSNAILTVLRPSFQFDASGTNLYFDTNGLSLRLGGLSGHGRILIYASTNLLDWVPILTNPPLSGALDFCDPDATNTPARFYRAQED